jgi:hypothetical protein
MTPYTADWTPDAQDALTLIWLQTFDPAVTTAQDKIDRRLGRNPLGHGRPLHEGLYQLVEPPLTVSYSIDQVKMIVEVSAVRYTP